MKFILKKLKMSGDNLLIDERVDDVMSKCVDVEELVPAECYKKRKDQLFLRAEKFQFWLIGNTTKFHRVRIIDEGDLRAIVAGRNLFDADDLATDLQCLAELGKVPVDRNCIYYFMAPERIMTDPTPTPRSS